MKAKVIYGEHKGKNRNCNKYAVGCKSCNY